MERGAFRCFLPERDVVLLDVGANDGGFARMARSQGFAGRIISFEPLSEPFNRLKEQALRDPLWDTVQMALGANSAVVEMFVAGNHAASSSFLEMTETHINAAPHASAVARESVKVDALHNILHTINVDATADLRVKLDVQGFEQQVLEGAKKVLSRVGGLWVELSLKPLYEGSWGWREAIDWIEAQGFELVQLVPGFRDRNGRLLQFDGVFLEKSLAG